METKMNDSDENWNIGDMLNMEQIDDVRFYLKRKPNAEDDSEYEIYVKPMKNGSKILNGYIMYRSNWKKVFENNPAILSIYHQFEEGNNGYHPTPNGKGRYITTPITIDSMETAAALAAGKSLMTARKFIKDGGDDDGMSWPDWKIKQLPDSDTIQEHVEFEKQKEIIALTAIYDQKALYKQQFGYDPFFNNRGIEIRQLGELSRIFAVSSKGFTFQPSGGSTGKVDFINPDLNIHWGELKKSDKRIGKQLTYSKLGGMEFNKQNNPLNHSKLFGIDCLVHSCLNEHNEFVTTIIVKGMDNMKVLHPLIKIKQAEVMERFKTYNENNEAGKRDGLTIYVKEILELLSDDQLIIDYRGKRVSKPDFIAMLPPIKNNKNNNLDDEDEI